MNKRLRTELIILAFAIAGFVIAQSDLLTADYSSAGWNKYYGRSEGVQLPESGIAKYFWVVKTIDVTRPDANGTGGGTVAAHDTGVDIPDNAIIIDGYIDVITATLPNTGTVAIHAQTANDLYSASTNLFATGIKATVPTGTAASAIKMTADRDLTYTIGTTALTQGVFKVYIECMQSQ